MKRIFGLLLSLTMAGCQLPQSTIDWSLTISKQGVVNSPIPTSKTGQATAVSPVTTLPVQAISGPVAAMPVAQNFEMLPAPRIAGMKSQGLSVLPNDLSPCTMDTICAALAAIQRELIRQGAAQAARPMPRSEE